MTMDSAEKNAWLAADWNAWPGDHPGCWRRACWHCRATFFAPRPGGALVQRSVPTHGGAARTGRAPRCPATPDVRTLRPRLHAGAQRWALLQDGLPRRGLPRGVTTKTGC
jgi:hypothetical protein